MVTARRASSTHRIAAPTAETRALPLARRGASCSGLQRLARAACRRHGAVQRFPAGRVCVADAPSAKRPRGVDPTPRPGRNPQTLRLKLRERARSDQRPVHRPRAAPQAAERRSALRQHLRTGVRQHGEVAVHQGCEQRRPHLVTAGENRHGIPRPIHDDPFPALPRAGQILEAPRLHVLSPSLSKVICGPTSPRPRVIKCFHAGALSRRILNIL